MQGLVLIVTGLLDRMYPLHDLQYSTPSVDIHINVIPEDRYHIESLLVEQHEFMTIAAGSVTKIEYHIERFERYQGWGSSASQNCVNTETPRYMCTFFQVIDNVATNCACGDLNWREYYLHSNIPPVLGCSVTKGTKQETCLYQQLSYEMLQAVPLNTCPVQCETLSPTITKKTQTDLSDGQVVYIQGHLDREEATVVREETAVVRVGLGTLDTRIMVEAPSTSFASLMGEIGGMLGLWCGVSFLTMVEVLEFTFVACLYGRGFYSNTRRSLRDYMKDKSFSYLR